MSASVNFYKVKARRPQYEYEPANPRYWMDVGVANQLEDGNVLIRLNALPFEFDGELKLVVWEGKKSND